jgi:hypothetical protein
MMVVRIFWVAISPIIAWQPTVTPEKAQISTMERLIPEKAQ